MRATNATNIRLKDSELDRKIVDSGRLSKDEMVSLKNSATEFESLFFEIMLKSMRDSIQKSNFIDGGNGEDVFQGMLDSEYSRVLASQGITGISDSIKDHLLNMGRVSSEAIIKGIGIHKYSG